MRAAAGLGSSGDGEVALGLGSLGHNGEPTMLRASAR